jgi:cytidylate kinase
VQQRRSDAPSVSGLVIAIDGPSGAGKSTVARGTARALGLRYLDTGAMYRALTWLALERGVDLGDDEALARLARAADLRVSLDPTVTTVTIDGHDVTASIRTDPVTAAVSAVSAVAAVRAEMVRRQREAIGAGGIVVEGRDIGTTVAPDAPVKVFLTADPAARARRREAELVGSAADGPDGAAATAEAMRRRDTADASRAASPLARADDAVVVDSTHLSADDVIADVVELASAAQR